MSTYHHSWQSLWNRGPEICSCQQRLNLIPELLTWFKSLSSTPGMHVAGHQGCVLCLTFPILSSASLSKHLVFYHLGQCDLAHICCHPHTSTSLRMLFALPRSAFSVLSANQIPSQPGPAYPLGTVGMVPWGLQHFKGPTKTFSFLLKSEQKISF